MYDPRIIPEPTIFIQEPWMWGIVAVLLGGAFYLTRQKPDWGLASIIAAVPLYQVRGEILGLPTTFLELLFGAVMLGLVSRWLISGAPKPIEKLRRTPYDVWVGIVLIGSLVAALVNADIREGLGLWRAFILEPIIFFYAVTAVFRDRDPKPLLAGALGALAVLAAWTFSLLLDGRAISYDDRLLGPYQTANYFALLLVPLIALANFWPRKDWLAGRAILVGLGLLMLFTSDSRGGFLALIAAAVVAVLFYGKRLRMFMLAGLVLAGVAVAVMAGPSLLEHNEDQVVSARPVVWREAGNVISDDPLFGIGPGQFQDQFRANVSGNHDELLYVAPQAHNAHNVWLVAWTEWGLLTLVALAGIIFTMIMTIARRFSMWMVLPATMLAAILVHGAVDTSIFKNDLAIVFWLTVAMTVALPVSKRKWIGT